MKCKGRIIFSGELFKLDLQSEEKVNAAPTVGAFNGDEI